MAFLQKSQWWLQISTYWEWLQANILIYTATGGENRVAGMLAEEFQDKVLDVKHYSDRLKDVGCFLKE